MNGAYLTESPILASFLTQPQALAHVCVWKAYRMDHCS